MREREEGRWRTTKVEGGGVAGGGVMDTCRLFDMQLVARKTRQIHAEISAGRAHAVPKLEHMFRVLTALRALRARRAPRALRA